MDAQTLLAMLEKNGVQPGSHQCAEVISRNIPDHPNETKQVLITVFDQIDKLVRGEERLY
jgi:hypothetical protein